VAEEVARFYLADAGLAARLKALRETIGGWDARLGLAAQPVGRDSDADPGRAVMGVRETEREGIPGLVRANLRRAEEAARVIEEVAKLSDPSGVSEYKEMRYTLYSVEAEMLRALASKSGGA
jgi:thiamine-phosphate pyrophosphorylase